MGALRWDSEQESRGEPCTRRRRAPTRWRWCELADAPPGKAVKRVSTLVKIKRRYSSEAQKRGSIVDPATFTLHLAAQSQWAARYDTDALSVSEEFGEDISWAVGHTPEGKAAGTDGVAGDMLLANGKASSKILLALWRQFGKLNCTPALLREVLVVSV